MLNEFKELFITAFALLFPIVNPIGNGIIVNTFFEGLNPDRRKKLAKKIALYCFFIGLASLILGKIILKIYGLSVPYIQIAGGLVICWTAWDLLGGNSEKDNQEKAEILNDETKYMNLESKAFYPFAFPIIMGAGGISGIFTLLTQEAKNNITITLLEEEYNVVSLSFIAILTAILVISFMSYIVLHRASDIIKRLGPAGGQIINRLIAFFMLCIGIQVTIQGVSKVFGLQLFQ